MGRREVRVMDQLKAGAFVLLVIVGPVSCMDVSFFSNPVVCYILDGFLMFYCIVATALFFREKFSHMPQVPNEEDQGGIYQELERPKDADPYQELEPLKRKKKSGKKKKAMAAPPDEREKDPYESLSPGSPPSP